MTYQTQAFEKNIKIDQKENFASATKSDEYGTRHPQL